MNRRTVALTVTATAAVTTGTLLIALAQADPDSPSAPAGPPELFASCLSSQEGALTALPAQTGDSPNRKRLLECANGAWKLYINEYPSSDRWLVSGPELKLHGQGLRNPEFMAGHWTCTPQTPEAQCRAVYVDVIGAGQTGDPQTVTADPGRPASFDASEHLFNITLTGNCLWERS